MTRLDRIRESSRRAADIDYLLSLIDRQATVLFAADRYLRAYIDEIEQCPMRRAYDVKEVRLDIAELAGCE